MFKRNISKCISLAICLILQLGDLNWHRFTRVVETVSIGNNATSWKTVRPLDRPVKESRPDPTGNRCRSIRPVSVFTAFLLDIQHLMWRSAGLVWRSMVKVCRNGPVKVMVPERHSAVRALISCFTRHLKVLKIIMYVRGEALGVSLPK